MTKSDGQFKWQEKWNENNRVKKIVKNGFEMVPKDRPEPKYDPMLTNRQRMEMRKKARIYRQVGNQ